MGRAFAGATKRGSSRTTGKHTMRSAPCQYAALFTFGYRTLCECEPAVRFEGAGVRYCRSDWGDVFGTSGAAHVVRRLAGIEATSFFAENPKPHHVPPLQRELQGRRQHAEAIFHAAAEVDGRGFFEILSRTGNFSDAKAEVNALGEHLVVENKIIRIFEQGQSEQNIAAEGAIAAVIFGQLHSQEKVLEGGEKAVGDVLPNRHAAVQSLAPDDARAEHNVINVVGDHARHGGYQQRRVLIIG